MSKLYYYHNEVWNTKPVQYCIDVAFKGPQERPYFRELLARTQNKCCFWVGAIYFRGFVNSTAIHRTFNISFPLREESTNGAIRKINVLLYKIAVFCVTIDN